MEEFCGSPLWDYDSIWATDNPDFTPCFKQTVFVWVPCLWLLVFTPLEINNLRKSRYRDIPWSIFNITKIAILAAMFILAFIDLGISFKAFEDADRYTVYIVSPIIKAVTFLGAAIFILFYRKYGKRSSGIFFHFSLLLMVCAIPQYRSEIRDHMNRTDAIGTSETLTWMDYQFVSFMIYFPLTVFLFIMACFADKAPRESDFPETKKPSKELSTGFLNKITFSWMDSIIWTGFRRPLTNDDIYDIMPSDTCKDLVPPFEKYWRQSVVSGGIKFEKQQSKAQKVPKKGADPIDPKATHGSVLPTIIKAYGGPFLFAGCLKLVIDLLSFASPFLLQELMGYIATDDPVWKGIVFALGLLLAAVLQSLLNGQYLYNTYLVGYRIRSGLVSFIYKKALIISNSAKKQSTVGEIVNLMAVDAQRFVELTQYLHTLWSGPLTIALCLYFLWGILGPSSMAGFVVMLLLIPLNGFIAVKLRSLQIDQMKKKDERVKFMNEILSGIKVLKLYAWEPSFEKLVQGVRGEELVTLKRTAIFNAGTFFIWSMAPYLVSLASFATYVLVDGKNILDAQTAFVSLSLFNVLRHPMALFPMMISMAMQTLVAISRINKFLNAEELDPNNVTHEKSENALQIKNGDFAWGEETKTLFDINMKVPKQSLIALVGPVGCGKTSVISAMLGEMDKISGSVNIDGSIAFVPQQAWIQNATLRDNILFGRPYDEKFYNKVLDACALRADIDMLPGGDQTEIGEKGINLSGGQKQRVSLARAVYSDSDIYLLDDPLSAVDSHVGKHIFDNVIGPKGILAGKSKLLVTHGIAFLPQMDEIVVMKLGHVTESGSYRDLLAQKGAFSEFLEEYLKELDEDDEDLEHIKEIVQSDEIGKAILDRALSMRSNKSDSSDKSRKRRLSRKSSSNTVREKQPIVEQKDRTKLIEKEESATGSIGWDVYLRYFKNVGIQTTVITIVANICNNALNVFSSTWLTDWSEDPESVIPSVRNKYLGVYGALGGAQAIAQFVGAIIFSLGALNAAKILHDLILGRTLQLPMAFFDTTPLGRIMNRFSKDIDVVDNMLPMSIRTWMMMFFNVISVLVVISYSTPLFLSLVVPIAIIYYFIQRIYVATSRQLKRIESVTRSPIYSHFSESITGQSTIRAYNEESRFIAISDNRIDYNQQNFYPSIISNRWLGVRLELIGSVIIFAAAIFAVIGRGSISPAIVGLSISYALQITQALSYLVRMTAEVETNIVAVERIEEYSGVETEAPWNIGEIDPKWPHEGKIEFQNFQVRYREGLDLVLKGITFNVTGNQKVGIVGRTGAGKSSLTLALFRIIESAGGKIVIDGQDIAKLGLHNLRSRLTIIPQDPVLFSGTLRMNIDPFGHYSDDDIWRVLELSHLKAFVKTLPAGLFHEVSEGGENMSVGQRQLVCLARALLRKTKVLILDEATAAIDLETDDLIQATIRSEFADCTILTIAHRLNTIMDSDKVLVLDQGIVAEFESPAELLKRDTSIFYSMAKKANLV